MSYSTVSMVFEVAVYIVVIYLCYLGISKLVDYLVLLDEDKKSIKHQSYLESVGYTEYSQTKHQKDKKWEVKK